MPYYCTVPQCTSMAGKAKDVSFHQFPRDEFLAQKWNFILKRGKPYTKYSKVCSRHFTATDYSVTNMAKHKGQWRTLRKDAIPSQNLPMEFPTSRKYCRQSEDRSQAIDQDHLLLSQRQFAQLIYMQALTASINGAINPEISQKEDSGDESDQDGNTTDTASQNEEIHIANNYFYCSECSRCFKDPSVYELHRRSHIKS